MGFVSGHPRQFVESLQDSAWVGGHVTQGVTFASTLC